MNLEGALKPLKATDTVDWPSGTQDPFQATLAAIVNAATTTTSGDPVLTPPLYGRWHAGKDAAKLKPPGLTWFDELNLDPRHRAVSAFGTRVRARASRSVNGFRLATSRRSAEREPAHAPSTVEFECQ